MKRIGNWVRINLGILTLVTPALAFGVDASKPNAEFEKILESTDWNWQADGVLDGSVHFFQDGTAKHSRAWSGTWQIIGPRTVVLNAHYKKWMQTTLTFDEAGKGFWSLGFNGRANIVGWAMEPVATKPEVSQSPSEVLSLQAPNAMEWALSPLSTTVPPTIRENLMVLREDLLDEAAKHPAMTPEAYKIGEQLCNGLLNALNERDVARVRAGYTAAQANANKGEVTNQALEARRHNTNWATYARENAQREEVRKVKDNGAALENQRPIVEWSNRGGQLRADLNVLYAQFREAARKPLVVH